MDDTLASMKGGGNMKQKGFTLIEVALSTILLSLLLAGVFAFFSTTYINYLQFEEKSRLQDEARIVEDFIRQEIESAKTVTIFDDGGTKISKGSSPSTWKTDPIGETADVKIGSIVLDDYTGSADKRSIVVTDTKTLCYSKGGTSNVLTDLLKEGSIYISKDRDSDIITIKLYLEKERDYRPNHPTTVHSFTTYIKISLKYKDDV